MSNVIKVFCEQWLPGDWEVSAGTEVNCEGWVSGKPRRCKVVRLVRREPVAKRLRSADPETLLRNAPHLAIALLRHERLHRAA
jgi:hypothetical protein